MTLQSSPLGRGGHRDDRRRRLLAEDLTASFTPSIESRSDSPSETGGAHKSEHYGDAEFLENQLRLTDLVPRRILSATLLLLACIAATAGIVTLYVTVPKYLPTADGKPGIATLGEPGGLGNWFGSLLLLAASFYAVVVYTIRRHKVDDYRGRYRIWLWAAGGWFLMASDVAASVHSSFQHALITMTHSRLVGDGSIWWLAPTILLIGWVGVRLLTDMQPSRLSSAAIILAAIAYLAALSVFYPVVRLSSETARSALMHILLLAGHLMLAWSMVLHARFVLLDAEGQLPRRPARPKAKRKRIEKSAGERRNAATAEESPSDSVANELSNRAGTESSESDGTWVAVDPPHGSGAPGAPSVLRRVTAPAAQADQSLVQKAGAPSGDSASFAAPTDSKLSKAERKALKKKQIEDRLKSEQRRASNW